VLVSFGSDSKITNSSIALLQDLAGAGNANMAKVIVGGAHSGGEVTDASVWSWKSLWVRKVMERRRMRRCGRGTLYTIIHTLTFGKILHDLVQ
jgi:hypothetical protein